MLLWEEGQRQVGLRDALELRMMRYATAEGVADVLVPMLTGKQRRRKASEMLADGPPLKGQALMDRLAMLGVSMPGLVQQAPPGAPRRPS